MRVREPDRVEHRFRLLDHRDEDVRLVTGINERGVIRRLVDREIRVLLKRSDYARLELHTVYPPVPSIGSLGSPSASAFKYFSAAIAAVVASPTAVVTCRVS